jgi:NAD+ synthase
METKELADKLVLWVRDKVVTARCQGVVIGMSGGVDSSVVAVLCRRAFPQSTLGLIMPCYSIPEDEEHARMVAAKFSIPVQLVILDSVYDTLLRILPRDKADSPATRLAEANLKSRLRMLTLYYFANRHKYLVVGCGNRSELATGYFTKYGDSGVDILPLGNLVKREVCQLATFLGIPRVIIEKAPSAGLWPGQTDEGEMGIAYETIDRYLTTGEAPDDLRKKLDSMSAAGEHKRHPPPIAEFQV